MKQHCYTAVSFICCELISSSGYYLAHRFDVHCLDSRGVNEGIHNSWPIYTLVITDGPATVVTTVQHYLIWSWLCEHYLIW